MNLILTSSRNPSMRIRQFLKSFSLIFPENSVQIINRGKLSLSQLLSKNTGFDILIIVTNRQGNPGKLIGYIKNNKNKFDWFFEFKIKSVKLHYELEVSERGPPSQIMLNFDDVNNELTTQLQYIFDKICNFQNINSLIKSDSDYRTLNINYLDPGFEIYSLDMNNEVISPIIQISEILLKDQT